MDETRRKFYKKAWKLKNYCQNYELIKNKLYGGNLKWNDFQKQYRGEKFNDGNSKVCIKRPR